MWIWVGIKYCAESQALYFYGGISIKGIMNEKFRKYDQYNSLCTLVTPSHTNRKENRVKTVHHFNAEKIVQTIYFNETLRVQMCASYVSSSVQKFASYALNCVQIVRSLCFLRRSNVRFFTRFPTFKCALLTRLTAFHICSAMPAPLLVVPLTSISLPFQYEN